MNSKLYSTSKSDTKLQKSNLRSQTQSNSNHRITKIFFFRLLFEFSLLDSCKSTLKILTSLAKAVVMILMVQCYLQRFGNTSFQFQGGGGGLTLHVFQGLPVGRSKLCGMEHGPKFGAPDIKLTVIPHNFGLIILALFSDYYIDFCQKLCLHL